MKNIFLFWLVFFILFFGTVVTGFLLQFPENSIVWILLALYFIFQGISLKKGFSQSHWWVSSVLIQVIFAVVSPLYYSNFWDPAYEFVTGEWFNASNAFDPCQLCWWARILMFPLLPLTIIFIASKSRPILWYIYGASSLGILLETFHYLLQKTNIPNPFGCTLANPCSALEVEYLGFITIPFLCLIAFLVIHIFVSLLLFSKRLEKNGK